MQIQSAQEALFIACEMERNAIALYDRALMLVHQEILKKADSALEERLTLMRDDEKRHLETFRTLYTGMDESAEKTLTLASIAADVLFPGGLVGAVRSGLLNDVPSMLRFAAQEEEKAINIYLSFAAQSGNEAACSMLTAIAHEEKRHLEVLQRQQDEYDSQ